MSNSDQLNILVLDDDNLYRKLASSILRADFTVYTASVPSKAFEIFQNAKVDILICDFQLPEMNGLEVVKKVKEMYPDVEIIMISAEANMDTVIEALRLGAVDFFRKPFNFDSVKISIEKTKKFVALNSQLRQSELSNKLLAKELKEKEGFEIISKSKAMDDIKKIMYKVAQSKDTSVIITGESGVGKELVARGVHLMSERHKNHFGAVNMSAVPEALFESEFFGHKKGAFTGAISDRAGWFEIADKGTLFLDEIGDMPMNLQIKMLRVLEDRKYIKVGSQKEQSFDVRLVAATNKDVNEMKSGKDFRLDLFHRLGTFEIFVPPLRQRTEDIPVLIEHYVNVFAGRMRKKIDVIDENAMALLKSYPFPGNVRELRNLTERAVILCDSGVITTEHFPNIDTQSKPNTDALFNSEIYDLELIEKQTILRALEKADYNKSAAAELLNIKWNALHRRLVKFNIPLPE